MEGEMDIKLIYNFERKEYTVYFDESLLATHEELSLALEIFVAHVNDVEV
jgi:hypothetical protein